VHVEAAARVARLARANGVERLIHVSGIGADPASSSPYIASRGRGEIAVRDSFPGAILIRPAVMFGPDDAFLTIVERLLRILPVYPMFGRGETKLQPVYVEDVAEGIARVLSGAGGSVASYEFAGARVYTYKELVLTVADRIGARPRLVPLPFALWQILALAAELLPGSPLTRNQVALMQHDNVPSVDSPGLSSLDITPQKSTPSGADDDHAVPSPAYRSRRNWIIAALTSCARSCCVQCPHPEVPSGVWLELKVA